MKWFKFLSFSILCFCLSDCAYHMGVGERSLPGGYHSVAIPVFKNHSSEPGIETYFTESLIKEFSRGSVARVIPVSEGEAQILGEIVSVQYSSDAKISAGDSAAPDLPTGTVLTTTYRISMSVKITLKRQKDGVQLWEASFGGQKTYTAPQITRDRLNSVDPIYNQSSRKQNIEDLSTDMMLEAYNRLTENF